MSASGPQDPQGYYPQQAYYAPGWDAVPPPVDPDVRRRRRRRVLVVAAAVVGALVLAAAVVGVRYALDVRPIGEVGSARSATVRQLDVGHCVADLPADGQVLRVDVVPCAEPHVAEVVATFELREEEWPGTQAVRSRVEASCEMDSAQQAAGFTAVVWSPTEQGWRQGDRTGLCLARATQGPVTGSFTAGDDVAPS